MFAEIFKGLFDSELTTVVSVRDFLICVAVALAAGIITALAYTYRTRYTKSFIATLALLPAVVCVVIMMVNGNIGAGVAVAGAFSLVRFRSAPGTAKEIGAIFIAMAAGLISGMGYIAYTLLFAVVMSGITMLYSRFGFGTDKRLKQYKTMRITIPENLDYESVFDDILSSYTDKCELVGVKTTNMGSLFRLTYDIKMKKDASVKEMIDKLRVRNGNLEISVSKQQTESGEL